MSAILNAPTNYEKELFETSLTRSRRLHHFDIDLNFQACKLMPSYEKYSHHFIHSTSFWTILDSFLARVRSTLDMTVLLIIIAVVVAALAYYFVYGTVG